MKLWFFSFVRENFHLSLLCYPSIRANRKQFKTAIRVKRSNTINISLPNIYVVIFSDCPAFSHLQPFLFDKINTSSQTYLYILKVSTDMIWLDGTRKSFWDLLPEITQKRKRFNAFNTNRTKERTYTDFRFNSEIFCHLLHRRPF
jgi:hypothetical protein